MQGAHGGYRQPPNSRYPEDGFREADREWEGGCAEGGEGEYYEDPYE
jgi:hypothetical protein